MRNCLTVLAIVSLAVSLSSSACAADRQHEDRVELEERKKNLVKDGENFFQAGPIQDRLEVCQEVMAELSYSFARALRADMHHDEQAFPCMKMAAELGCVAAQHDLAVMIGHGLGCEKNLKQAIEWYTCSADGGYALAENNLGAIYELGREGVERDELKALELYERAAKHGLVLGRTNLERLLKELDEDDEGKES